MGFAFHLVMSHQPRHISSSLKSASVACRVGLIAGNLTCEAVDPAIFNWCQDDWALLHSLIRLDLDQLGKAVRAGLRAIGAQL